MADKADLRYNTIAVTTMFASASGMNRRHPKSINWSYRKRGSIHRTQMNTPSNTKTFPRKMPIWAVPPRIVVAGSFKPNIGSVQPPKKSVTIMPEAAIMLVYSPMKNIANFIEPYSV